MRFYAACLASYNNGILHGRWIDANSDTEEMQAEIMAMLKASRVPGAEEWAIHDTEDLPSSIGEYSGLVAIADWVELVDEFAHIDADALVAIAGNWSGLEEARENLRDRFVGCYGAFRDYADEHADECILAGCDNETVARYFDYEAFARDLRMDMTVIDTPSGVAVFYA